MTHIYRVCSTISGTNEGPTRVVMKRSFEAMASLPADWQYSTAPVPDDTRGAAAPLCDDPVDSGGGTRPETARAVPRLERTGVGEPTPPAPAPPAQNGPFAAKYNELQKHLAGDALWSAFNDWAWTQMAGGSSSANGAPVPSTYAAMPISDTIADSASSAVPPPPQLAAVTLIQFDTEPHSICMDHSHVPAYSRARASARQHGPA